MPIVKIRNKSNAVHWVLVVEIPDKNTKVGLSFVKSVNRSLKASEIYYNMQELFRQYTLSKPDQDGDYFKIKEILTNDQVILGEIVIQ